MASIIAAIGSLQVSTIPVYRYIHAETQCTLHGSKGNRDKLLAVLFHTVTVQLPI